MIQYEVNAESHAGTMDVYVNQMAENGWRLVGPVQISETTREGVNAIEREQTFVATLYRDTEGEEG